MNNIEKTICDNTIKALDELTKVDLKKHVGETAYSECSIQEGYHEHLKIEFKNQQIRLFRYDFDSNIPCLKIKSPVRIEELSKQQVVENIIPTLKKQILSFFFDKKNQPMFRYFVKVNLIFKCKAGLYNEFIVIEDEARKLELRKRINNYISSVFYNENGLVESKRYTSVFCGSILDFNLTEFSPIKVIEIINHCINFTFKSELNKELKSDFEGSILFHLDDWVDNHFKPLYFDISGEFIKTYSLKVGFNKDDVEPEMLELWVYASFLKIKLKNYPSLALKELQLASKEFGSETAKQYLNLGTGLLANIDTLYKDEDVVCKANDVLATIAITIKNETSESYSKALDFIINLLQKDFPASYAIKLSSKSEKSFFPIKGIARSSTHRFFFNCVQYPELHDKIEQYALISMKEFEWYEDVAEGEKSCLPGTYAVFGLGLYSENYFPLIHKYFQILDHEHQMAHRYFINNLIDQYAITKKSIALICDGILSSQFEMIYKNLTQLMNNDENLKLLIDELTRFEKYNVEEIIYSIWGRNYLKTIKKLNPILQERLIEQLNK